MGKHRGDFGQTQTNEKLTECRDQEGVEEVWAAARSQNEDKIDTDCQRRCSDAEANADGGPNVETRFEFAGLKGYLGDRCFWMFGADGLADARLAVGVDKTSHGHQSLAGVVVRVTRSAPLEGLQLEVECVGQ